MQIQNVLISEWTDDLSENRRWVAFFSSSLPFFRFGFVGVFFGLQ